MFEGSAGGHEDAADCTVVGVTVAPIPVPATLPLLAAGLGLFAWRARRG